MRVMAMCLAAMLLMGGCTPENTVSQQERALQDAADSAVAGVLFEQDLDQRASYSVHKDGSVTIKFARSVQPPDYTRVVETLRRHRDITAVRAEQAGAEVCPLR